MTSGKAASAQATPPSAPPKPVDYAAEPMIVEQLDSVYRFSPDGTGARETTVVSRMQSDAAARQSGVLSFSFAGNSERVEIDYVRVRKPDGSTIETPISDAQEMPLEVTRQAPFYSDLKEKQIPVRNLRMGDKLEYKIRIVVTRAEVPGQFWGQDTFGRWAVILSESVELHVPKSKYVKVWSPTVQPAKTESGDEVAYRWTGSQMEPTTGKDSKLKQREIDPKGELPTLAWTTFKSWEDVGTWYRGLEGDRATPDAEVKAKAAELIAGKTTDEEKAKALYGYVATQIRYIGVAFGVGRYQPHPASEVLRNQYGDCKDKHTLLAAMLTAAGLHPSASLIGAGIRLNEEVPSPSAFNHMITAVPVAGKQVWVDSTAEVAPWEMLVATTRDKQTLVVPDTGSPWLEKTPQKLPFDSFNRFVAKGTLSKEGTMKAQIEYTTRGDDELLLRTLLRQVSPGQWDELSQRLSQGLGFSGTTSHTEAGRPDQTAEPARIAYDYEREKTGDWDNHRIVPMFPVVFLTSVDDKNPPKIYPIQLGEPRVETSLSVIRLPAGWGAELPAAVHQKTAYAAFDKTYKIEGDTLTTERRLEVLQREVPAAEWKAYKKWYDTVLGDGEPFVTLISTDSKASIAGSGESGTPSAELAPLLKQFYEQMQRGEANAAAETVEKIRKIDPNSIWAYRATMTIKLLQGNMDETLTATRALLKQSSATAQDQKAAAAVFEQTQHYDEALPLLTKMADGDPDDLTLQRRLGTAQLRSGLKEVGQRTLTAVLAKSTTPDDLNNISYELADAGVALEEAETNSRKAIDLLTEETTSWSPGSASKDQKAKQSLLVAAWDTLGWALFREGKTAEAEGYLRAAWLNTALLTGGECAIHLGELEEKRGNLQKAMAIYQMGLGSEGVISRGVVIPRNFKLPKLKTSPIVDRLNAHVDALKKRGVAMPSSDTQSALTHQGTLQIGARPGKNLLQEYVFLIADGRIAEPLPDTPPGVPSTATAEGKALVERARAAGWTPPGSRAKLIRKGTLNCHSGACDLVMERP